MQERIFSARIISGNRVTVPHHIIEELELNEGERVDMTIKRRIKREGVVLQ